MAAGAGTGRVYAALGAYVAEHAIAVEGPIREYYVDRHHREDLSTWRTKIGRPIFRTGTTGTTSAPACGTACLAPLFPR